MSSAPTTAAGQGLRQAPASAVLAVLALLGVLTVVAAVLTSWAAVVVGLVLMQLGTATAVLGPWGRRPAPTTSAASPTRTGATGDHGPTVDELRDLQKRVDALGARLVASSERTRVELLDALGPASDPSSHPDR
ncbi:hypothetical protein ACI3ET_09805 [Ornithinimicrobium sp. LYQ121]|uniref:hypothetical protein n=1 Tax=Ornithinimicrobium sp. LYQ121 TaxID=3378801 RepID=UPI003851C8BC